jgi:hypothetical protein
VFQLAAVGVELVTGRRAFGGGAGEVMQAMRSGRAALGGLPEAVLPVFQKALAAVAMARWPTAGAFADALEAALRQRPLQGGRSDIGAAVRRAQQRVSELEAEQLSGAMVFPLPAAPPTMPSLPVAGRPPLARSAGASFPGESTSSADPTPLPPPGVPSSRPSLPTIELDPSQELLLVTGEASRGGTVTDPEELIATSVHQQATATTRMPLRAVDSGGHLSGGLPSLPSLSPEPAPRRALGRKRSKRWLAVVLGLVIAGAGGFLVWQELGEAPPGPPGAPRPLAVQATRADAGHPAVADASPPQDVAASPPAPDAGPVATPSVPTDGRWRVVSTPPGAAVWLDGVMVGKTPFERDRAPGKHHLALILPGYTMHRAEIVGEGEHAATLAKAKGPGGPGAIKVRCQTKGRLYIIVNGTPTGELCPSERIRTPLGKVTVETYDPKTDASRAHEVVIKPGKHGSQRIHLED